MRMNRFKNRPDRLGLKLRLKNNGQINGKMFSSTTGNTPWIRRKDW